jgi:hypothetical protein
MGQQPTKQLTATEADTLSVKGAGNDTTQHEKHVDSLCTPVTPLGAAR